MGSGMCYLCPGNIRGPGTRLSWGNPGRLSLLRCCCQGGRGKSQLPEPHSLYGALLSSASADCRGLPAPLLLRPPPSSLLRLLPPPSLLLSPSAILLEVLKLLTRFLQWPGVYRAPPSPRPHPHPREQRPDFPSGAKPEKKPGEGHRAVLSSHCHTAVTHPHQCQGPGRAKARTQGPSDRGGQELKVTSGTHS